MHFAHRKEKKTGCENQSLQGSGPLSDFLETIQKANCLSKYMQGKRKNLFKNSTIKTNPSNFTSETIVGLRNKHNQKLGNQTSEKRKVLQIGGNLSTRSLLCKERQTSRSLSHFSHSFLGMFTHVEVKTWTLRSLKFLHSVTASPQQALSRSASAEADLNY